MSPPAAVHSDLVPSSPDVSITSIPSRADGCVKSPAPAAQGCAELSATSSSPSPLTTYLSEEGLARQNGTLRSLVGRYHGAPGVISLAAGFPPQSLFPISGLSLRLEGGPPLELSFTELAAAQQYNSSLNGYPPLVKWIKSHVHALHRPPGRDHEVLVTNGNNHTVELLTSLFLDRGGGLLVEEYTYPVILESIAQPKGYRTLAVPMDDKGMVPGSLRRILEDAIASEASGGPPRPKLLYTIPTGHNPTGVTTPTARRQEIYELCRQYDIWILEDDPYYYLQWSDDALLAASSGKEEPVLAAVPGLTGLFHANMNDIASTWPPCSYLSMDVDQRVIRADTFSKFLAPGLRLGWVTARNDVITKLIFALQTHTVGPCSLSQVIVTKMIETWGEAGLDAHLRRVQAEYSRRCAVACGIAETELKGLAIWQAPKGGMFLWVELLGIEDVSEVWEDLQQQGVIVCPGSAMRAAGKQNGSHTAVAVKSPFIRVSFSGATDADLMSAIKKIASVMKRRSYPF